MADSLYGSTNLIHMVGRSRVRLSWETHYVGDLRSVDADRINTIISNIEKSVMGNKLKFTFFQIETTFKVLPFQMKVDF